MTQDVAPQHPQQQLPEQQLRYMPAPATGPGTHQQAKDVLSFGAAAAARGLSEAQVAGFFGKVQDVAAKTSLETAKELLELVDQVTQARLMEVSTAIARLPQITMAPQQGIVRTWLNGGQVLNPAVPLPGFVSVDAVNEIVVAAIAAASRR